MDTSNSDRLLNKQSCSSYSIHTLPKTCRLHALHPWRFDVLGHVYRTLLTSDTENCWACSVLYKPTNASNTSDGHQPETATGGLRMIWLHLTSD